MNKFEAALNAVVHGWAVTRKLYLAFRIIQPNQLQVSVTHTVDLDENSQS